MGTILAYTSPARGHLFPSMPILEELRDRGHRVSVRTLGSQVELLRGLGFEAEPIDPAIERIEHDDFLARTPVGGIQRTVQVFNRRAEIDAPDMRRAIDEVDPDAVMVDIHAWGARAIAEDWGGPWACWCPHPLPLRSHEAPPFGPGLRPARGPLGRLRDTVLNPIVYGAVERTMRPGLNEVRARVGVPPLGSLRDMVERMPLLLYMTGEPFEYPRSDWPSNVRMVGACDWDPPGEPPSWLEETDEPIVLVTTSSEFQDDAAIVRCALEALGSEPVLVVATLPSGDPGSFEVPTNGRLVSFVPHGLLLDRAVCAVTHGGMGATQKALARGVPVCAIPHGRDQLEVARRVETASAGTRLAPRRLRPARLREAINEAIGRADGARRVADGYSKTGGARAAAEAIEALDSSRLSVAA